jgi:hypothetical protein
MLNELPWNAIDLHQSVRRWPVPPTGFLCRGMRPPRTKRPDRSPRRLQTRPKRRDVQEDDSNNEVAPSRGGEQIDDVLDGFVGAVVGGFESAVWAILRVRTAVEAAVGKWSAQPFVEEQKKQRDLNTL